MAKRFEGKVAIVTGGGKGIGRASALAFADEGAAVTIADIDRAAGEETRQLIADKGGRALFVAGDIADESYVKRVVAETVAEFGGIDVLHNNAASCATEPWWISRSRNGTTRLISTCAPPSSLANIAYPRCANVAEAPSSIRRPYRQWLHNRRSRPIRLPRERSPVLPRPLRLITPGKTFAAIASRRAPSTRRCWIWPRTSSARIILRR